MNTIIHLTIITITYMSYIMNHVLKDPHVFCYMFPLCVSLLFCISLMQL